jgi:hypothetical protein
MQVLLQEHFLIMIKDKLKDKKDGNMQNQISVCLES